MGKTSGQFCASLSKLGCWLCLCLARRLERKRRTSLRLRRVLRRTLSAASNCNYQWLNESASERPIRFASLHRFGSHSNSQPTSWLNSGQCVCVCVHRAHTQSEHSELALQCVEQAEVQAEAAKIRTFERWIIRAANNETKQQTRTLTPKSIGSFIGFWSNDAMN